MEPIPKIIHYCWFGRGQMPELVGKCMESWKKNLPDYELKLWSEDSFDININNYVKEAYQAKKYAFVTDYVRLYALYHFGGIYLDTDVEVLKSLNDFLHHEAFSGFQTESEIPTGLLGAKRQNDWIGRNLRAYEGKAFLKSNGSYDLTANVAMITNISLEMGFIRGGEYQVFGNGIVMYPVDYFCAKDYQTGKIVITDNTTAIHHFAGSWLPFSERVKIRLMKTLGYKRYNKLKRIFGRK